MSRNLILALAFGLTSAAAMAADPATPAKPAAKPAAAAPAKKAPPKKAAEATLPPADQAQLDAAERTLYGPYECEFDQKIDVAINPKFPGYVDLNYQKKVFTMKPVLSSTGALRLEDVKGNTLLLQIANKSMLMDVKAGKRLVDGCVHEKQRAAAAAAAAK
jgi:hypothetical protein